MNILKIRISGLSVCSSVLDLDFCASQKISENARQQLIDLNGSLFLNPVIEFAGLNGTGKTVLLNVLFFVMRMLNGRPLNNQGVLTDRMIRYMNHRPFTVETWYFLNGEITHLTTDIGLEKDFVFGGDPRLIILSETISVMSRNLRNKTEWLHSEKYQRTERRPSPEENPYLLDDVSMNIVKTKDRGNRIRAVGNLFSSQEDTLHFLRNLPEQMIHFLNPGIEKIEVWKNDSGNRIESYTLKFVDREPLEIQEPEAMLSCLSTGTIMGLRLFSMASQVLKQGGYLVEDDLEAHLNIEITKTLIRLFQNKTINKGNGVLVFSSHCPELMYKMERNDSVYIFKNRNGIACEKASETLKRNDGIRKSEAFISDYFHGTAPDYNAWISLKEWLQNQ